MITYSSSPIIEFIFILFVYFLLFVYCEKRIDIKTCDVQKNTVERLQTAQKESVSDNWPNFT